MFNTATMPIMGGELSGVGIPVQELASLTTPPSSPP